jgi:hypothetical protein
MARVFMTGFEAQDAALDLNDAFGFGNFSGSGMSYETTIVRTGAASLKYAAVSGVSGQTGPTMPTFVFGRVYIRVTSLPTTARQIIGDGSNSNYIRLNTDGTLSYLRTGVVQGTSATALTDTTKWYMIEFRGDNTASVVVLRIDGVDQVSGQAFSAAGSARLGTADTVASAMTLYYDDMVLDDAVLPGDGAVALLVPISDNAVGTGWTLGTGTAISSNGWSSVDNKPPQGVTNVEAGSDPKQIRNASSNANSNYDANLTTYATAGIAAADTINAVWPVVITAAPVTTSSKQGTVGVSSNPVIANIALGAGGTAGAFWSGTTEGTYTTGWKISYGTLTASPSVTVGSSPVMRITQVTSSTRIATVCFMGLLVDYTPAAVVAGQVPYTNPMPQRLAQ